MGNYKPKLSTIFLCLGLFLVFLIFEFPYQNLRGYIFGKIHSNTGILIVAEEIYPSFFGWPGLGVKGVNVTLPIGSGDLDVTSDKLIFRVGLSGFFPPVPSISLSLKGLKKGGNLFVKFSQTSSVMKGALEASDVVLDQLVFSMLPEPIQGKLNTDADFYIDRKEPTHSSGQVDLGIDKLRLPGQNIQGIILPALNMGTLKAKLNLKNGVAEISSFNFGSNDSDIRGAATGEIRLGQELSASFLNLSLTVSLSEAFRKNPQSATLVSFLESFKTAENEYGMKWSATFQQMSTNIISAIPQKVTP
jgi:type II secretion system protein N